MIANPIDAGRWITRAAARLAFVMVCAIAVAHAAQAARQTTDRDISDAVEDKMRADFVVPINDIDVTAADGIVSLKGTVGNLLAKERAVRLAQAVRGVRAVINDIRVRPHPDRTPERIKSDILGSFQLNPATEALDVGVDVGAEGKVVLSGTVDSWSEKDLAEKVAKSVAGVTGVSNRIDVTAEQRRSDADIMSDVEARLRWNALVDDGLIDVRVDDGTVHLAGAVGSAAERRNARVLAWVTGVDFVDVSDLRVEPRARDEAMRQSRYRSVTDAEITKAIEDALRYDPRTDAGKISADVAVGTVILRGAVQTLDAKRVAGRIARNTVGVEVVENRIKVRTVDEISDNAIAERVRAALERDPLVERRDIEVDVNAGIARLEGAVGDFYEKMQADDVVARVAGVTKVDNELQVADRTDPVPFDPYVDPNPPEDYGWYEHRPRHTSRSDERIRQDIQERMWWNAHLDVEDISIEVDQGVATLTGTVDSYAEAHAARQSALEAGAASVINRLEVRQGAS